MSITHAPHRHVSLPPSPPGERAGVRAPDLSLLSNSDEPQAQTRVFPLPLPLPSAERVPAKQAVGVRWRVGQ